MFNPITPQSRYQMKPEQVERTIDDLLYRNYKFNRLRSPHVEPERWDCIYGDRVSELEKRFQLDRER